MTALFVTGTDTGVGKTRASTALLRAYAQRHPRCVGMKPVAAGCDWVDGQWLNEDVVAIRAASSLKVPPVFDNPYALPDPVSPHIAARLAGERIDLDHIESSFHALKQHADVVVVEGAGGFLVPFHEGPDEWITSADLAIRLQIPVVMVVGVRLGCLNHALLTQEAILTRGLTLAGWVANVVDPTMPQQDANIATLQSRLHAPMLARWGWQPEVTPDELAQSLTLPL
ncbi:MAG TPA: dethiobiotin synthase [Aquabacterium sp.]|nr:dethiobiotin synthase [Aquabacterium sp.]